MHDRWLWIFLKDQCDGETSNSYGPITQID